MDTENDDQLHIDLPRDLKARCRELARQADMSLGQWVRAALRDRAGHPGPPKAELEAGR